MRESTWRRKKEYRVFFLRRSEGVTKHEDFFDKADAERYERTLREDPDVVSVLLRRI